MHLNMWLRLGIFPVIFFLKFIAFYHCLVEGGEIPISLTNSRVFGPGLNSNFTVPVRYFFIELLDYADKSVAADKSNFFVQIAGLKGKCRIWYQLLKVKVGLFVTRFRIFEPCAGLRIDVTFQQRPIAKSPYFVEGLIIPEKCYCPKPMTHWLKDLSCPMGYHQINEDLSIFPSINMESIMKDALERFNQPGAYSLCHYAVLTNKVYRKCYGQYVGFSMFMDEILLSLTRKAYLPDVEMLVNLGDWPLEQREVSDNPIPIFSWCGSKSTRDIIMPTYDITESTLEMMGRVMLDVFSVMDNAEPPWSEKEKKGFWRGRDSRQERLDLVKISRQYPEKIDAALTNFFFFRNEEAEYGPKADYVSFFDFFKYKYQINIDGTVAAYRMPYLLSGGSLVLKQDSDFYEHFYRELKPMVHYVPFNRNLSNLVDQIDWAVQHDEEGRAMAEKSLDFALQHLLPKDILCYYAILINEYSKRLDKKPKIHEGMELVKQPEEKKCTCNEENLILSPKEEL